MKKLDKVVLAVLIFSGITWGIWGILEFNFVGYIIRNEWISRLVYFLLGAAGIYVLLLWKNYFPKKK